MKLLYPGILLVLFSITTSIAQVTVLKDISTKPADLTSQGIFNIEFLNAGDYSYFRTTSSGVPEIWQTDGTAVGTKKFINNYQVGAAFGTKLIYGIGDRLFITNGSNEGTQIINLNPDGTNSSGIGYYGLIDTEMMFSVKRYASNTDEIWKTDGTTGGTSLVATLDPSPTTTLIDGGMVIGGYWYFRRYNYGSNFLESTTELWRTDGTEGGTSLVKSFGGVLFVSFAPVDDQVIIFSQSIVSQEMTTWISDGTAEGTKVFLPITGNVTRFVPWDDKVIVINNGNIVVTDGTPGGTASIHSPNYIERIGIMNGEIYAIIRDNETCAVLHSDGTLVGTDVDPLPECNSNEYRLDPTFTVFQDHFFTAYYTAETGFELGWSDGTAAGTTLIKDIMPGGGDSFPASFTVLPDGSHAIFLADDGTHGREVWITDGTEEGTMLLKDVKSGTANAMEENNPTTFIKNNDYLYFWATNNTQDNLYTQALWRTDGTTEGTEMNYQFYLTSGFIGINNDKILLDDSYNGKILSLDGLENPDPVIKEIPNNGVGYNYGFDADKKLNGVNIFPMITSPEGRELWVSDGTTEGTHILADIDEGPESGFEGYITTIRDEKMYFSGGNGTDGYELWITDGTAENTTMLKDINPTANSYPRNFFHTNTLVFFNATDGVHGTEVWKTDGTAEGTSMVKDVIDGPTEWNVTVLATSETQAFFAETHPDNFKIWVTDGTEENTTVVFSNNHPELAQGMFLNGKYFFGANTDNGWQLISSDGTENGTSPIFDLEGRPSTFTIVEGFAYFNVNGKMYRTAGFEGSTGLVTDMEFKVITYFKDNIVFEGYTDAYGIEIYKAPYTRLEQDLVFDVINAKTMGDAAFEIHAEAASDVTFTSNDKVTIDGTTVTLVSPGLASITATAGNQIFEEVDATNEFCINPAKPTIAVNNANTEALTLVSSADDGNIWFKDGVEITGEVDKNLTVTEAADYSVKSVVDGCAGEESDVTTIVVTGIEQFESLMRVYPNPASKEISIEWNGGEKIGLEIMNIHGQKMYEAQFHNRHKIDLGHWSNDLYVLKLQVGEKVMWKKVVKQ